MSLLGVKRKCYAHSKVYRFLTRLDRRRHHAGTEEIGDKRTKVAGVFYTDHEDTSQEGSELEVRSEIIDGVAVFRIAGKFDTQALTNEVLQSGVGGAVNAGNPWIIFDMREVNFITSAGVRVVLMTAKRAAAAKGGLSIFGVRSEVNKVFEISGLTKIIPIASDEAEARSKLGT
jgi:anti-anti-sigma factor